MEPHRQKLLASTEVLLDEYSPQNVTMADVLASTGLPESVITSHFEDFDELVEEAALSRLALQVSFSREQIRQLIENASNQAELLEHLSAYNRQIHAHDRANARSLRLDIYLMARRRPRMAAKLHVLQSELNESFASLIRLSQQRGWVRPEIDAVAASVFVQAYTIGMIANDVSAEKLDERVWVEFIDDVLRRWLTKIND